MTTRRRGGCSSLPLLRRLVVTALLACLGLGAVCDSAAARIIRGTAGSDHLIGTPGADSLFGRAGDDSLEGRGGDDLLDGGPGRDRFSSGRGVDRIVAHGDEAVDSIGCGAGRDIVNADLRDSVAATCELVSRQLSRDPLDVRAQHQTQVEPDTFSFGSTIVSTFQSARFQDGGAATIGWATSRDGGRSWRSGFLPRLTIHSTPAGRAERVSDPAVAYDAVHGVWLIASLAGSESTDELLVSRSPDGVSWRAPVAAATGSGEAFDKEWITCDNWPTSPYRGRCYISYLDLETGHMATRTSGDGGLTWSQAAIPSTGMVPRAIIINGAQPIVRPDGSLVVLYSAFAAFADASRNEIGSIRSTDGGVTFGPPTRISRLFENDVRGMRAPPFPSVESDADGTIYAAWHDCRFQEECIANDIVLATSRDGVIWSAPTRVPLGRSGIFVDHFVPGLAVDRTTAGRRARVAIAYHAMPQCDFRACRGVDIGLITSSDGGQTWGRPDRLNAESMPLWWIADGAIGRMLGDYISTSYVNGRPIPVFALASRPVGDDYRQAIFALTSRR